MIVFDKSEIRQALGIENIYDLLIEWGGDPEYTEFGILSATICHNPPGEGSRKLYFYENTGLFHCYTGCDEPSFDIFELCSKIMKIQYQEEFNLNDSVLWIARRFGLSGMIKDDELEKNSDDWKIFSNYSRIQEIELKTNEIILKEYDSSILDKMNYSLKITPWLKEGISEEVIQKARIGFYPGGDQITIPHYDINNRFVGLRGRSMCKDEAEQYGKYRPIKINNQLYNHPLGMNLYGLNWSKKPISIMKKAIVFESE